LTYAPTFWKSTSSEEPSKNPEDRVKEIIDFLEREVWPQIPEEQRGTTISQEERELILGIGPRGYPE